MLQSVSDTCDTSTDHYNYILYMDFRWNILGLQGSLLSLLIPTIKIDTVIVGGNCPFSLEAMERGLYKRFNNEAYELKIVQSNISFKEQKNYDRTHPCPSSIIWCAVKNR